MERAQPTNTEKNSIQHPYEHHSRSKVAGSFQYRYHQLTSPIALYATTTEVVADLNGLGVGGLTLDDGWYHLVNVHFKVRGSDA